MKFETKKMVNKLQEDDNRLVFSYLTLRNLVGFCGAILPVILSIAPARPTKYHGFEPSISDYFYTDRGDILVVTLCLLGAFLFTYKGYTRIERLLTIIAAIAAVGIAFVPTTVKCDECALSVHTNSRGVFGQLFGEGMHLTFAAVFLLCAAIMSLVYFPRTNACSVKRADGRLTQKGKRNIVYKICGWVMVASIAILGLYFVIHPDVKSFPIIFVFETIAVEAFALSWLTKGETLWPDGQHYIVKAFNITKGRLLNFLRMP